MALPNSKIRVTPEEYLRLEELADFKSEYVDGLVYPLGEPPIEPDSSKRHGVILENLIREIDSQLLNSSNRAFSDAIEIRTPDSATLLNPDLCVVAVVPRLTAGLLENPTVIFEVLSPSTEAFESGKKFGRYCEMGSFTDYVLIAQDEPRIEHRVRQNDDGWLIHWYTGLTSTVTLATIGCSLKLADIYDRIDFGHDEESALT